jgi:rod shape-determining protein MreC
MDSTPPPFFRQGVSADVRLALFSLLAIALLVADARLNALDGLRRIIGTVLYPVQRVMLVPQESAEALSSYFADLQSLTDELDRLRRRQVDGARELQQAQHLAEENARLRQLLGMREQSSGGAVAAEVLYETRDPFSRRLVIDRGIRHGVRAGQPVIDAQGVIGQVARVMPLTSEVMLLTDRDATLAVELRRNGLRAVAYGAGRAGGLELRYLPAASDVQLGDLVFTSGLDGVFPAGLPVGQVGELSRSSASFALARVEPAAGVERTRLLLVLFDPRREPVPQPEPQRARPRAVR